MQKQEFINISKMNIEELSLFEKIALNKLIDSKNETIIKIFNTQPEHLKKHEIIYITKYLDIANFSLYINNEEVFVAPKNANEITKAEYFVPENAKETPRDEIIQENRFAFGYSNLKKYNISADLKYRLIKHKKMTGYASIDKPWEFIDYNYNLENQNMIDFYNKKRPKMYKCKYSIQDGDDKTTWDEFNNLVTQYAKSLASMGVQNGEVVPVCTKSIMKSIAMYFALDMIGATTFFLDPANSNIERMNNYYKEYNVKHVITTNQYAEKINESLKGTSVENIISLDYKNETNSISSNANIISESSFIQKGNNVNLEDYTKNNDLNHTTLLTSTSGTTGEPKLVELTRKNLMSEALYMLNTTLLKLGPNAVNMQVVSFEYPYGFAISAMCTLFAGKTLGLCPDMNFENYIEYLRKYKPAYIHGIPPFYKQMVKDPRLEGEDMSYLSYPISGGDYYSVKDIEEANQFFEKHNCKAKIKNGFGSAEGTACITAGTVGKYNIESVGKPLNGITVKIIDNDMNELSYGSIGKIAYTGENVMKSYGGNLSDNQGKTVMKDGKEWIITDAIGFIDNEGFVYIVDRDKNLFITLSETGSGFKIYPNNVAKKIKEVEGVEEVIVVKQENDTRGYVPVAFVTIKNGYEYDEVVKKINEYCQEKLENYAVPFKIYVENEIVYAKSDKVMITYYEKKAQELHCEEIEPKEKIYGANF